MWFSIPSALLVLLVIHGVTGKSIVPVPDSQQVKVVDNFSDYADDNSLVLLRWVNTLLKGATYWRSALLGDMQRFRLAQQQAYLNNYVSGNLQ